MMIMPNLLRCAKGALRCVKGALFAAILEWSFKNAWFLGVVVWSHRPWRNSAGLRQRKLLQSAGDRTLLPVLR
jgi:hypothetical protein